jgi:hypothetical protein
MFFAEQMINSDIYTCMHTLTHSHTHMPSLPFVHSLQAQEKQRAVLLAAAEARAAAAVAAETDRKAAAEAAAEAERQRVLDESEKERIEQQRRAVAAR